MIKSFRCKATEQLFNDRSVPSYKNIDRIARRKLEMVDAAQKLSDLRNPPANRLELLRGNRAGQLSIRINDQYRICFRWEEGNAYDVEIVDYH